MNLFSLRFSIKPVFIFIQIAILLLAVSIPILLNTRAEAAQLTSRSITLSSAIPAASSVTYTFGFTLPTATTTLGIKFQACSAAIGTCSAPTGLSFSSRVIGSPTGFTGTSFAVDPTGAGDCTSSASVICINRLAAVIQWRSDCTIHNHNEPFDH